ncbi:MFS transporter [Pseudomonas palleroniana]|uniref:MFS transporter n=1 Tax=Pseudomonas palleroniana TaxID=191390 RepID=A0A2L1J5P1_9PSED|nr:MFS transporter [Pseudomonas palleroniana]AVE03776.1 MFS transporter [Pseudomonas palleroniana]
MTTSTVGLRVSWFYPGIVIAAVFAFTLLETMLVPVLPFIQRELNATPAQLGMVFTGLLLSGAVCTPLVGRMADIFEKRLVLLFTILVLGVGVVVAALAPSFEWMALGQVLQGAGMGLIPLSIGLLNEALPVEKASRCTGLVIGASTASMALGLVLGGPIEAAFGFRWVYWLPLSVLVVCGVLVFLDLVQGADSYKESNRQPIDWWGAVFLSCALIALLLAISTGPRYGWTSSNVMNYLFASAVLFSIWVYIERRVISPLVEVRLLAKKDVALTGVFAFGLGFASVMSYVLVPAMVASPSSSGIGFDASATSTGFYILPLGIMGTVAALAVSKLEHWIGDRYTMALSGCTLMIGAIMLATVFAHPVSVIIAMSLIGISIGLGLPIAMNAVVKSVPVDRAASVCGVVMVVRNIGGTLGVQLGFTFLAAQTDAVTGITSPQGFIDAFYVAAAFGLVAIVATFMRSNKRASTL